MMWSAALALALFQQADARDTTRAAVDPALMASAYLNEDARALVRGARERRRTIDRSVERYEVVAQERISLGIRALGRDRLFYRREVANRIDWKRDGPVNVEVLGAREVIPPVFAKARLPEDIGDGVAHLAFDPADTRMLIGWSTGSFVRHPLAEGSEAHYRFRATDTTVIALQDGRRVRLRELEIIPRRKDVHLMQGSFWIDSDSHAVVRAGFRLADDFDLERDGDEDDDVDDIPGLMKPIRATLQYVTIEYGLWDLRWWMPRVIALEGAATIGRMLTTPLTYERVYSGYQVTGAAAPLPPVTFEQDSAASAAFRRRCRSRMRVTITIGPDGTRTRRRTRRARRADPADTTAVGDTTAADSLVTVTDTLDARAGTAPDTTYDPCDRYVVTVSSDTAALLNSELLPPDPYIAGIAMVSADELKELTDLVKQSTPAPWQFEPPDFRWGLGAPGLVRYNRVEGFSIGARSELDFGRLTATGEARIGIADLEPNGELSIARQTFGARHELTGYRRLTGMDPLTRPFTFASSLSALVFGQDDAHYYRTLGVELSARPHEASPQWYDWRLFAQLERPAEKETDFSFRHLVNSSHLFGDNAEAARATQYGTALTLRAWHGHDPLGFRGGVELGAEAATGTFDYVRPSLTLRSAWPLPGRYVGALEIVGGTTFGHGAEQHLWRVGGPATVRGYDLSVLSGESFWRARLEFGTQFPAARLVVFSDAGRAGPTEGLFEVRPLLSAGVGASLLDGMFRLDLARALRAPTGWKLTLSLDGRL